MVALEENKNNGHECSLDCLTHYNKKGDDMLSQIITGDETWFSHFTPESKYESMELRHTMYRIFWDNHGVLIVDFIQRETTINAETYCQTLRKLRRTIKIKKRGILTRILLLHDNTRTHTASQNQALLDSIGWEVLDQPTLAPSNFHLAISNFTWAAITAPMTTKWKLSWTLRYESKRLKFYEGIF